MELNIDKILEEAYKFGMVQNIYEIKEAAKFFQELKVKDFIEIGTDQGGTFLVWSKLSDPNGLKISVDWPHGPFGSFEHTYNLEERNKKMKTFGNQVHIISGDSHSESIKKSVQNILGNKKVDFIFIDGDHTYTGVKLDFYMYKEFVKPGGWIGFHDIKNTEFHRSLGCYVDKFWDEIQNEKKWFLSDSNWGGIGLVKV